MDVIYLDNSATTKICKEALDRYVEVSLGCYGNPSSLHNMGSEAEKIINGTKKEILLSLGERDGCDVILTASGTESNNLAVLGRAYAKERFKKGAKLLTTMGEHASVNEPLAKLQREGYECCYIPTLNGEIDFNSLEKELNDRVILVSVMLVNNETGAVYDLPRVAKAVKRLAPNALIHVDCTQGYLKFPFTMSGIGADMITISSHKIEGPKGVGALVINKELLKRKDISAVILGGGQERGLRSGTENVPGIAAFGEAVKIGYASLKNNMRDTEELRSYLLELLSGNDTLKAISPTLPRLHAPHILNLTLPDIKSETMLHFLSSTSIYVSSGSACSSNTGHISSALTAYGRSEREADCSIRISFSHNNTKEEVDLLALALEEGLRRLARIK